MSTVNELKVALGKAGISFPTKATKSELEKLLKKAPKEDERISNDSALPPADVDGRLTPPVEDEIPSSPLVEGDYLRQYQYKKLNPPVPLGHPLTDPDKGSKAENMKKALLKQPRVRMLIQREAKEDPSVLFSVNLN